jgi:hypothetical protein
LNRKTAKSKNQFYSNGTTDVLNEILEKQFKVDYLQF